GRGLDRSHVGSSLMATMTLPDAPAPQPMSEAGRYPTVFANLLPDEVVAARHVRVLQKNVFLGLAGLLVLLVLWYGFVAFNTSRDRTTLATYLDKLATVKGLAVPYPVSVLGKDGKLTFTVQLVLTTDVLGGRYVTQKGN